MYGEGWKGVILSTDADKKSFHNYIGYHRHTQVHLSKKKKYYFLPFNVEHTYKNIRNCSYCYAFQGKDN